MKKKIGKFLNSENRQDKTEEFKTRPSGNDSGSIGEYSQEAGNSDIRSKQKVKPTNGDEQKKNLKRRKITPHRSETARLPGIRHAATLNLGHSRSSLDNPRACKDPITENDALTSLHQAIAVVLSKSQVFTVFYISFPNGKMVEDRFGWEALEALTGSTSHVLRQTTAQLRSDRGAASLNRTFADDFVILCPSHKFDSHVRHQLAEGLARHIAVLDDDLASVSKVYVGMAHGRQVPRIHPERLVYRTIQHALHNAMDVGQHVREAQARILETSMENNDFMLHYQPIVRSSDMSIYGHEALVRCTTQELASPLVLFDIAEKTKRARKLSRMLRRMTAESVQEMPDEHLMFMNLHPDDLADPELLDPPEWLTSIGKRMVLEITERAAIEDFQLFRNRLSTLRKLGFVVAIDDLGSGYSALNTVAELEPEIIKLDMLLIRGIEESRIRQDLVRKMVSFAQTIDCQVVAEGIETKPQMEMVRSLGCHLMQGFYLARPAPQFIQKISTN